MPVLSSRQQTVTQPTDAELIELATPSLNIVEWLSRSVQLPDGSVAAINAVGEMIFEVLGCMELFDFAVVPIPPSQLQLITYSISVQPIDHPNGVTFQVQFRIEQP